MTEPDFQKKLAACRDMIKTYLDELKVDRPVTDPNDFDTVRLQDTMGKLGKILSHDATKLSLACKPPRKPQDGIKMIQEMSNTFYRLMGFYHTIPPEKSGQMYKSAYRKAIQDALLGASSLVSSFSSSSDNSKEKNVFMVPTAVLWEACKRLQSEMPKNNADAAARAWKTMLSLLKDAQAELKGICEEDEMAKQCQPVVDLAVFVFIKIEKRCLPEKQDDVAWYDRVCQAAQAVVDETDVLVSQLYEEEPDVIHKSMAQYNRRIWTLVEIAQEVAQGEHAKWFEMCVKKLNDLLPKEQ